MNTKTKIIKKTKKIKNPKIIIFISIGLCIIGLILSYFALNTFNIHKNVARITSWCNISGLFDCDKEAKSRFTLLFGIPISYFNASIYLLGIILLILYFITKLDDKKSLILFAFEFFIFIILILSIFTIISMLIFENNLGFYYLLFLIKNITLTIIIYLINKEYLKEKIFDNKAFKRYKKEINFYKYNFLIIVILLISLLINYFSYKLIENYVVKNYQDLSNKALMPQEKAEYVLKNYEKEKKVNIDTRNIPYFGSNKTEAIVIIKFTDFRCPYCFEFAQTLHKYMEENPDKIKVYTFLFNFDKALCSDLNLSFSCLSLYGAYLANKKNKYKEYYEYLFLKRDDESEHVKNALKSIGISYEELKTSLKDSSAINWVKKMLQTGRDLNITGTPTIFIEGRKIGGNISLDILKKVIQKAIQFK